MLPHDFQANIELTYSKQNIRNAVLKEINESQEVLDKLYLCVRKTIYWMKREDHYTSKKNCLQYMLDNIPNIEDWLQKFYLDAFTACMASGKQTSITAIVGQLAKELPFEDYAIQLKRAAEFLYQMHEAGLIYMTPAYLAEEGTITIHNVYMLSQKTLDFISRTKFMPPMVIPPKPMKTMRDTPYMEYKASCISRKARKLGFLKYGGHVNMHSLNLSNNIAFSLDMELLHQIEDELEEAEPDCKQTQEEREQAHARLTKSTAETAAILYKAGNRFYFAHYNDHRGREYIHGYEVTPQGNSYRKAMINFADKVEMPEIDEKYKEFFN